MGTSGGLHATQITHRIQRARSAGLEGAVKRQRADENVVLAPRQRQKVLLCFVVFSVLFAQRTHSDGRWRGYNYQMRCDGA